MVASGFYFPEAPRWRDGQLWFSDVFGGLVYSWDPENGEIAEQAQVPRRPSGLGWTPDGQLLVVSTLDRTLRRADRTVVADLKPLSDSKINDMVVDTDGTAPSIDPAKVQARAGGEIVAIDLG